MVNVVDGYFVWTKGTDALLSYHFKAAEFDCQCRYAGCVEQRLAVAMVDKLEAVRRAYGYPITITSGYRCRAHQRDLVAGGKVETVPQSTHEKGHAADIKARLMTKLVPLLKEHFKALGLARTWAHVDLRDDKVRRWSYT